MTTHQDLLKRLDEMSLEYSANYRHLSTAGHFQDGARAKQKEMRKNAPS